MQISEQRQEEKSGYYPEQSRFSQAPGYTMIAAIAHIPVWSALRPFISVWCRGLQAAMAGSSSCASKLKQTEEVLGGSDTDDRH